MTQTSFGRPVLTERGFNENIHHIISDPLNALVEIISNCSDAGAEEVNITWPDDINQTASIEDNGEGMTEKDFESIWPRINYNRIKSKGKLVTFRIKREGDREAYGQHGKGRHAPFCFADSFIIETWKDGFSSKFKIRRDKDYGFNYDLLNKTKKEGNGTKISFKIQDNYRDLEIVKNEIGARFLTDPSFEIKINKTLITLADLEDYIDELPCKIDGMLVKILKIKPKTKSRNTNLHGVIWIIGKKRIKTTKWENILDGRITEARQYSYVVHSEILRNELNDAMNDFKKSDNAKRIQNEIITCIKKSMHEIIAAARENVKKDIIKTNFDSIKSMSCTDQDEVGTFITDLQTSRTTLKPKDLQAASEIFINIKNSKNPAKFFNQIYNMDSATIDELSDILSHWSVKEIRVVYDVIYNRLKLIEEIEKKCNDPKTLELQQLQPLFEAGLWIFGPKYEAVEFTSNQALSTVAINLFNKKGFKAEKSRLRPDFVVLPEAESSVGIHSCDSYNDENESSYINRILFLELKRGGFNITRNDRTQVEEYIDILMEGGAIPNHVKVEAYVMGSTVTCKKADLGENNNIKIIPMPYHTILKKAEKRLLNLRKKIEKANKVKDEPTDSTIKDTLAQSVLGDH